jgi:hypothetical protein
VRYRRGKKRKRERPEVSRVCYARASGDECLEISHDKLVDTVSGLIITSGMLYTLRRSRPVWKQQTRKLY